MERLRRIGRPAGFILCALAFANVALLAAYATGLRINTTASMPTGVYRVSPYRAGTLVRATLVAFCLSGPARDLARARHYLGHGPCPGDIEPLLKEIAAVAGDRVDLSDSAVRINGLALPSSGRIARDCADRPLALVPTGRYVLSPATVWLYAPAARSWDSRYYGPQRASGVLGIASPVLIIGHAHACAS